MPEQAQPEENSAKRSERQDAQPHANELNEPVPHIGQALDGRHYLDVLEEQTHAESKPQPDGENPRHPDTDTEKR